MNGRPSTTATNTPARRQLVVRLCEWIWRAQALRNAHASDASQAVTAAQQQRARIAAEVGARTLDPSGPWLTGDASHLASALFAESIGWSLLASASVADTAGARGNLAEGLRPPTQHELISLLSQEPGQLLAKAAGDADCFERVRTCLLERSFDNAASPTPEQLLRARDLSRTAQALLKLLGTSQSAVDRFMLQRVWRLIGVAGLLVVGVIGAISLWAWLVRRGDLSAGKPWLQSSSYEAACVSPARHCENGKDYFFHTLNESSPWLELDLLREQSVGKVSVVNRSDCCAERAVPLIVEVSTDHRVWREVVRRVDTFDTWRASFKPTQARWVRFRVGGRSFLHLHEVRVFR